MTAGVEVKYILLFAILIALTGFTYESQKTSLDLSADNKTNTQQAQVIKTNTQSRSIQSPRSTDNPLNHY